ALGQLGDKRMLLENLRVAPARRPIEFGDNGRRVVAPHLINAIFVAVERKQTAIAANADAFERVENAIRRETLVRRSGSGHRAHSTCRYRAICGVRCYRFASVCIGSIMTSVASIDRIAQQWDSEIVPLLVDYVRIPAKSPHFDPAWAANGHIENVTTLAERWTQKQPIRGLAVEIVRLQGRTPLLVFEVPASQPDNNAATVLLYGHLDKQPEMTGWREGLGPWIPVIEDGKLYGRGSADDGYAVFAALSAIAALDAAGAPHARCIGIIETCEESGSYDLPAYLGLLAPRLGRVEFVVGLDSGCGDYERLWVTTSLRGLTAGTLTVDVLTEGVHSGDASGIVPSSFRIARHVLDRLEDSSTGWILPSGFHAQIPLERVEQAGAAAAIMGDMVFRKYPF